MCFASFGSEVDTAPLVRWCLDQGKRVALPRIVGKRHMEAFWVTDPAADLESGSYGIREPRAGLPQASPEAIDLVVVPGSAFDRSGDRMGYGGGFYDTFLPRLQPRTPRVAVAFELQLVDDVPEEDHDLRIDVLVTERGVLRCVREDAGEASRGVGDPYPADSIIAAARRRTSAMSLSFFAATALRSARRSRDAERGGASRAGARHLETSVDLVAQLADVRDDADQTAARLEAHQRRQRGREVVGVERAEPLVDEDRVELHAALVGLHDVGEPERQRQRRLEGLSAGEGRDVPRTVR